MGVFILNTHLLKNTEREYTGVVIESRATQKLRAHARANRLLLRDLGPAIGYPFNTVQSWLYYGKIPNSGTIRKLAEAGIVEPNDWFEPAAAEQAAE